MKKHFLLLLCILIFTSCSKEFSREDAKQLIESEFNYPYVEFNDVRFYNKRLTSDGKYIINKTNIKELVDKGILGFREVLDRGTFSSTKKYYYNLKSKGKKLKKPGSKLTNSNGLVYGFFPIHLIEFDGITGIKFNNQEKTSAIITYNIKYINETTFRKLSGYNMNNLKNNLEVNVELFDDGWRLKNNKIDKKLIPLSEFPNWSILNDVEENIDKKEEKNVNNTKKEKTKTETSTTQKKKKPKYEVVKLELISENNGEKEYKFHLKNGGHIKVISTNNDKEWKFKNDFGEKNRGNKVYSSENQIAKAINN